MDHTLQALSVELIKLARSDRGGTGKKQKKSWGQHLKQYGAGVAAAAPFSVAKGLMGIPQGVVEKSIYNKVRGTRTTPRELAGFASGKTLGTIGVGSLTAPLFISGMKDLRSKDKKDRRRGMAKVLGSGAMFTIGKSGIKAVGESVGEGRVSARALRNAVRGKMTANTAIGLGAGLLTARTIGKSLRPPEPVKPKKPGQPQKRRRKKNSMLGLAGMGAAIGAGEGAVEQAIDSASRPGLLKRMRGRSAFARRARRGFARRVLGRSLGQAAVGAALTPAMSVMLKKFLKKQDQKAATKPPKAVKTASSGIGGQPTPLEVATANRMIEHESAHSLHDRARDWATRANTRALKDQYNAIMARGAAERSPARRAVTYAFHDELNRRGEPVRPLVIRDKVEGPLPPAVGGAVTTGAAVAALHAPDVVWASLASMERSAQDEVLNQALDQIREAEGLRRLEAGSSMWGAPDARYVPEERAIYIGERQLPEIMAHELGHARAGALRRATIGSDLARSASNVARIPAVALPLVALYGLNDPSFTSPEDLENRAKFLRAVGMGTGLLQAPTMVEELVASRQGLRLMRQAGASPRQLQRALGVMAAGAATYAAPIVAPFVAARLLKRKARSRRRREAQERARTRPNSR